MSTVGNRASQCIAAVLAAAFAVAIASSDLSAQCDTWQPLGSGVNNIVDAIGEYNSELIIGGLFNISGGQFVLTVARWDGSTWQQLGNGLNNRVLALAIYNGELIAGGVFTMSGAQSVNYIARWDGTAWQPLGTGMNFTVTTLTVFNGDLIAGGSFTTAGGQTANYIARWDGSAWQPLGTGFNNSVTALMPYNGELIAGGQFSSGVAGGINYIARWDGTTWHSFGNGTNSSVLDLAIYNNDLVACGDFTVAGALGLPDGLLVNRVAGWNGSGWYAFELGLNFPVYDVTIYGGALTVGGIFTASGSGQSALRIARWSGTAWQPMGSGMDGGIYALGVWGGKLIAGGQFFNAGGQSANMVAQWENCPTGVSDAGAFAPGKIALRGVYVAGSGGAFDLEMPAGARARLTVHDVAGRLVGEWDGLAPAEGSRRVSLESISSRALPSGVYFGRAEVAAGPIASVHSARTCHLR
jgi:hypothetical protein